MTPEQFCYWLQGQFELKGGDTKLSKDQIRMIADHLQSVFTKAIPVTKATFDSKTTKIC